MAQDTALPTHQLHTVSEEDDEHDTATAAARLLRKKRSRTAKRNRRRKAARAAAASTHKSGTQEEELAATVVQKHQPAATGGEANEGDGDSRDLKRRKLHHLDDREARNGTMSVVKEERGGSEVRVDGGQVQHEHAAQVKEDEVERSASTRHNDSSNNDDEPADQSTDSLDDKHNRKRNVTNPSNPQVLPSSSELCIGAAMYDITGPAAEVGMFGYAKAGQLTSGIHMRLRARAFAFHHLPSGKYCVYVVADVGMISEWVTQAVLSRLEQHQEIPNDIYSRENVMISATHTHCSPGGLSHYFIYSMHPPLRGADRQNFECVVDGIVHAIVRAHSNMQPAVIRVSKGKCLGASVNRSEDAYNANPPEEREQYEHDTDKEMTLWRFDGVNGYPIGMINWFAVHPTSMGNWYTLITGDNKGYAAHVFEREHGTNHLMDRPRAFVAAFAQSNEGDVSPNICGPRHCETQHKDFERMLLVANAQLKTARELYTNALSSPSISGGIKFAHQYVEFGNIHLKEKWHLYKECPPSTSSGCIGVSMMGGTTFDGRGLDVIPEGVKWGAYPKLTTIPQLQGFQKEKPVFFPTARCGLSPTILPLQLFFIADCLAIAAVPFEVTTMAGRRLRASLDSVFKELGYSDVYEPVISGLSNAYCGYLTTREEYAVQRYEGASTHFGPNQLCATSQQFEILAHIVCNSSRKVEFETLPPPRVNGVGVLDYNFPVLHDGLMNNTPYGHVVPGADVMKEYRPGATATVSFHAAHPKNNLRTQGTFLEVHRWILDSSRAEGGIWVMHADDGDANTFFHWRRQGTFASVVTIEWSIPSSTPPGKYRIKVNGDYKHFFSGKIKVYSGVSSTFEVINGERDRVGDDFP
uniref:Neutral ceramidase n=1 Tax=Globisporangium ultimum (strain ATCC 200006 / CBS 805.95 / DAOM BR144) TaxID=431595 RepID=K3WG82_GLOUD